MSFTNMSSTVDNNVKGIQSVSKKLILSMKTIHFPNEIRPHSVKIAPMAPFTLKSTSKLRLGLQLYLNI